MFTPATPISQLTNIGEVYTKRLAKLEIKTVGDLTYHFPFRYQDYTNIKKINQLALNETATVTGTILNIKNIYTKYGKKLTKAILADETDEILIIWFNQHYLTRVIKKDNLISISGKIGSFDSKRAFVSPEWEAIKKSKSREIRKSKENSLLHTGRLVPVYPETYGVTSKWIRRQVKNCVSVLLRWYKENDFLPEKIKEEHNLLGLDQALSQIHLPANKRSAVEAKERLGFDEMFLLQLRTLLRKKKWEENKLKFKVQSSKFKVKVENFINNLPFQLTSAQKRCVSELTQDLDKDKPMNRLLEGDVGSGKTVVAAIAAHLVYFNGYQSVFMAPTEILAKQHYKTLLDLLSPYGIEIELITGSRKISKTRNEKLEVKSENSNFPPLTSQTSHPTSHIPHPILVGTHALLYHPEVFDQTALVIIDEQHRFGVEQRAKLLQLTGNPNKKLINQKLITKQPNNQTTTKLVPHILTMTATPIPRTLALTVYGDLDLSIIDEMPENRLPVKTWVVPLKKRQDAYKWIKKQIQNSKFKIQNKSVLLKNQVFIVCPFIEESETLNTVKAATKEFEALQKIFPELKLGLLHGRMKNKEKDKALQDFRDGKIDILVSTPVVEVGIDIPNASIMIIEGAERFGLASLHQLRGRVGRGGQQAYCLLFTSEDDPAAINRLKALEKYHNGPKLAEIDLRNRGMGELFGIKQHGFADLKIASFSDTKLLAQTKEAAKEVIDSLHKYPLLAKKLEKEEKLVEPN